MPNPEAIPGDYDDVTRLRLQLHHAETKAAAFEASLRTDVLKVAKVAIYQAMLDADSKAADTIGCMGVEVDDLRKDNARLKAEVEMWKLRSDNWQKLCQISKEGQPTQVYVGQYPNPVNLVPIKPAGDDKKGDAS